MYTIASSPIWYINKISLVCLWVKDLPTYLFYNTMYKRNIYVFNQVKKEQIVKY